jgi:hypothetical protein
VTSIVQSPPGMVWVESRSRAAAAYCCATGSGQSQRKTGCRASAGAASRSAKRNRRAFLGGRAATCAFKPLLAGEAHSRSLGLPNFLWKFAGARDDKGGVAPFY